MSETEPEVSGFAFDLGARGLAEHPWQEYNAHGNTCHHPGCRLTEEEHAEFLSRARGGIVRSDVTADNPGSFGSGCMFSDVARVFVIAGNPCCGGDGFEASCEVCRRD